MPGNQAARGFADLRRQEAATPKLLYAIDGTTAAGAPVAEVKPLESIAVAAVRAGGGHVLETSHVTFPNGAITLVLILAESHLSIHTWPEQDLIAIDLFSCGAIDGETIVGELISELRLGPAAVRRIRRGQQA
jgi:S-adenosylmethionine decarboxylase